MDEDLKELSKYHHDNGFTSNTITLNSEEEEEEYSDDDSDNEIEEEIDIYLNDINENNLNNINTYLIQYPLRPKYRPYNYTNNIEKIYKCKNYNKLKYIKNNNVTTNEDTFIFEYKLQEYMEKKNPYESTITYKNEQHNKNISRLISTSVLCEYVTNCIGVFKYNEIKKKKEIYLIPLKHIYQFKPCFDQNINFELNSNGMNQSYIDRDIHSNTNTISISTPLGISTTVNRTITSDHIELTDNSDSLETKKDENNNNFPTERDKSWTNIVNIYEPDSYEAEEIVSLFTNMSSSLDIINCYANNNNSSSIIIGGIENMNNNKTESDGIKEIYFNSDASLYLNSMVKMDKEDIYDELNNEDDTYDYNTENKFQTLNSNNNISNNINNILNKEDDIYMDLNMFYFSSLSLDEQILKIMRIKNVQNFKEIQKIIKNNVTSDILLSTIQKYCINILGLWVVKSKYLYKFFKKKEKLSENEKKKEKNDNVNNFTYVDYKIKVRDLLLVIIYKQVEPILTQCIKDIEYEKNMNNSDTTKVENGSNKCYYYDDTSDVGVSSGNSNSNNNVAANKINSCTPIIIENFEKATNLSNSVLLDIFNPLCEYKYTGYFFKHKIDKKFISEHINLCLSFNEKWKKKMLNIAKIIQTYKNNKTIIINDFKLDKRTLEKNITDLLHNNCLSFDDIYNKLKKDMSNTNIDLQTFLEALNNIAININNMWALQIETNNEFNKCRNGVIKIYQNDCNLILSKKELIKKLEEEIKSPITIPDIYFRNILKELCVHKDGKYMFKGNDILK
ncbi:DNA-directed RNA polymerase III subunit RPC5, putative, partial [Hepatocystis sp. ex Piliocolobus tephrosceles]